MKKLKAFYIRKKDGKILIRFTTKHNRPHQTWKQWGFFIVFGKNLD